MSRSNQDESPTTSQLVQYQLWIAAAAAVIFFTNLGGAALWDMDEALYAQTAREMFQGNNWIVPMFNGQVFAEKPPLMFWTMIAGFELFGNNEFGARFFSAVFGLLTALLVFHFGRILFNARTGFWAGLITASTIIFTISARAATVDAALTLVTTAAFLMFALALNNLGAKPANQDTTTDHPPSLAPLPLRFAIPLYALTGLAWLAKGPVGTMLPLVGMGFYLIVLDGWRNLFRSAWRMRPFTAIIVTACVVLPWHAAVGEAWLREFYINFNLRPFSQPILGHGDVVTYSHRLLSALVSILYFFYFVPAILVGFFPWSVFLGPTVADVIARIRRRDPWRDGCLLAVCWFSVWFVFWSICKTKLPHYLMPAYPALALLTACFIERWQLNPQTLKAFWLRNAWISMILAGLGIMIAIPIVASIYLPGEEVLGLVGVVPLLGGAWCWWKNSHGQARQTLIGFTVTAVIFLTLMFGWGAARVDSHQNAKPMIAAVRQYEKDHGIETKDAQLPIATYRFFRESTVTYSGHPVTRCEGDDETAHSQLRAFLEKSPHSVIITTDDHEADLNSQYPDRLKSIFRQRRFLANGEMIVFVAGGSE